MRALSMLLVGLGLQVSGLGCGPDAGQEIHDLGVVAQGLAIETLHTERASQDELVIRRLWEGAEPDFWAASVSPDGRFVSERDMSTGDLAVVDLLTGQLKRVTNKGSWNEKVEWAETSVFSPDGRQLAYTYFNQDIDGYEIRVIGVDGSNESTIVPNPHSDFWAWLDDWSDDGGHILARLWYPERPIQIGLISFEDGSVSFVKEFESGGPSASKLSPDGRFIAYDLADSEGAEHDIFLLPADGGQQVVVLGGPDDDRLLGWTPDGSSLLFYSDRGLTQGIWILHLENGKPAGEPTLLRGDVWRLEPIGFSRQAYYFGVTTQQPQVHTAGIDFEAGRLVTPPAAIDDPSLGRSWRAAWSPDGRHLAYVRASGGQRDPKLIVRSVTGADSRDIAVPLDRPSRVFQWTADGQAVLIQARDSAGWGIFRLDLEQGTVDNVLHYGDLGSIHILSVQLSLDEKTVYFARWSDTFRNAKIMAQDRATAREREITTVRFIQGLALSPDGRTLAFADLDREDNSARVATVSLSSGELREIYRAENGEGWSPAHTLFWSTDGRHVLFTNPDLETDRYVLWRLPVRGGEPSRIDLLVGTPSSLSDLMLHPDGNRVSFVAGESRGEIWVAENVPGTGI